MSQESQRSLAQLQDRLFEALIQFDKICMDAGCEYSLMCGTLLGAVRHKGFIPWDDDVDVVMFRDEYEKFHKYCAKMGDTLKAHLDENDTWVPRIRIDKSENVFVDIFILDKVASKKTDHNVALLKLKILQGMMKKNIDYKRYSMLNRVLVLVTHLLGKLFSFEWKYRTYHQIARQYNGNDTTQYYIADGAFSVISLIWDKSDFDRFVRVPFRDKNFPITAQYKTVLTKLYGPTYMELPPEEERVPKHN